MSIPFSIYNRDDTTITRVWNFWIIISLTLSMTLKSLVKLTLIDILSTNNILTSLHGHKNPSLLSLSSRLHPCR